MGTSPERLLALFLSVSDILFLQMLGTDTAGLQPPLMVAVWWPSDARKECGLGSGMIHDVCISSAFVMLLPHSAFI